MSKRRRFLRAGVAAALTAGAIPVCAVDAAAGSTEAPTFWVAEGATGGGQSAAAPMSPASFNALDLAPGTRVELTGDQPIRSTLTFDARDGGSPSRPLVITQSAGGRTALAPPIGHPGISITDTSGISLLGLDVDGDGSEPAVQATYTRGGDDKAEALVISGLSATHVRAGVDGAATSPDSGLRGLQIFGVVLDDAEVPSVVLTAPQAVSSNTYEDVRITGVRNRVALTAVTGAVIDGRGSTDGVSVTVERSTDVRIIGTPSPAASPRGTIPAVSPAVPGADTPSTSTGPSTPSAVPTASGLKPTTVSPSTTTALAVSSAVEASSTAEAFTAAAPTSATLTSITTAPGSSTKTSDVAMPGLPMQASGSVVRTDQLDQVSTSAHGSVVIVQQAPAVGGTANWSPSTSTASETTRQIRSMTDRGTRVLLQIGGTATPFTVKTTAQARHLAQSVGTLADKYGFTGVAICLDAAGGSWTPEAISDAVHQLKTARGSSFTVALTTAIRGEHTDRLGQVIDKLDQQPDLVVVKLDRDALDGQPAATASEKIEQLQDLGLDADRIMMSVTGSPDSRATDDAQAAVRSAGAAGVLVSRRDEDGFLATGDQGTSTAEPAPSSDSSSTNASPAATASVGAPTSTGAGTSLTSVVDDRPGVPWLSGASDPTAANGQLAAARGTAITVGGTWTDALQEGTAQAQQQAPHWMLDSGAQWGSWDRAIDIAPGGMVTGMTWKQAATGELDDHWRAILTSIRDAWDQPSHNGAGYDKLWIRPFHEFNGNWYPWSVAAADLDDFKTGWKRWAQLQREILPGSHITWCANAGTLQSYDVRSAFPGGEWVDDIGVDFYNNYPYADTVEKFRSKTAQVQSSGGPIGLDAWLQWAKSQGKQLAIPEWSSDGNPSSNGGGDAPIFFEQMHAWLVANHQAVSREVLFNIAASDSYALFPADQTTQPLSAATYLRLW